MYSTLAAFPATNAHGKKAKLKAELISSKPNRAALLLVNSNDGKEVRKLLLGHIISSKAQTCFSLQMPLEVEV